MFENIEREYKKNSKERKFNKFYWMSAIILTFIFSIFKDTKYFKYCNYIIIFLLVGGYFVFDYIKTMKKADIKKGKNFFDNLKKYIIVVKKEHMNNLIMLLKKYNFRTKNDIKLAIEYYNSKRPIKIESNFLGWLISVLISLASIVTIAYDASTQTIDYKKISVVFGTTIGFVIVALIPILLIKILINNITFSKEKLHSELSEDLSFIYINFDKYKNKLTKK